MSALAGIAMVGAGAVCLGGAITTRRWISIVSAGTMLLAMLDLAYLEFLPAFVWTALLLLAGMLLGLELRLQQRGSVPGAGERSDPSRRHARGVVVASALAYPMMAWLSLAHSDAPVREERGIHASHGSTELLAAGTGAMALVMVFVLLVLLVGTLRSRRYLLSIEAGAMSVMILAMLLH